MSLCGGDMRRYRLAILFMMTFVGMPTVFYGDELGVQGLSEEEYRCPMPWDNENSTLCTFFKEAIAMRKKLEPLRCGDFRVVSAERGSGLIIYAREYCNQRVTICINRGGAKPLIWTRNTVNCIGAKDLTTGNSAITALQYLLTVNVE